MLKLVNLFFVLLTGVALFVLALLAVSGFSSGFVWLIGVTLAVIGFGSWIVALAGAIVVSPPRNHKPRPDYMPYAPGHERQRLDAGKALLAVFVLPYVLLLVPIMVLGGKSSAEATQRANKLSQEYLGIDLNRL